METTSNSISSSTTGVEPQRKKRFRAKLDHMSQEEKQQRRKEKNRQAAQTARDRKRKNMDRLEEENRRLREENMKLRSQILGNGQPLPMQTQDIDPLSPTNQIHDSGVSDVGSKSPCNSAAYLANNSKPHFPIEHRTATPDSTYFGQSTMSPASSDTQIIDTLIERDNDVALVNEVQKLVKYVECESADERPVGSAVLIDVPQPQVRENSSTIPHTTVNSLGWTSIQLMLILLISRIHHRLSARIHCCRRELSKSTENDQLDPVNCNLYDYILHTKCMDFRRAAEAIISNKNHVRQQRLVALDFVHKYLYNVNLTSNQPKQQSSNTISVHGAGCLT